MSTSRRLPPTIRLSKITGESKAAEKLLRDAQLALGLVLDNWEVWESEGQLAQARSEIRRVFDLLQYRTPPEHTVEEAAFLNLTLARNERSRDYQRRKRGSQITEKYDYHESEALPDYSHIIEAAVDRVKAADSRWNLDNPDEDIFGTVSGTPDEEKNITVEPENGD